MKEHKNRAVSIFELLISIILLSVIVLALASIDLFSRHHVVTADRRARLQNQVYYIIEHMGREMARAVGNESVYGADTVTDQSVAGGPGGADEHARVRIFVDGNGINADGRVQNPLPNNPDAYDDHWIAYFYYNNGAPSNRNTIRYCARCRSNNNPCPNGTPGACAVGVDWATLSSNVRLFIPAKVVPGNYLDVIVETCHDPTQPGGTDTCGNVDNPIIRIRTNIKMPSVAIR